MNSIARYMGRMAEVIIIGQMCAWATGFAWGLNMLLNANDPWTILQAIGLGMIFMATSLLPCVFASVLIALPTLFRKEENGKIESRKQMREIV